MIYKSPNSQKPFDQIRFLIYEIKLIVNHRNLRWFSCWFAGSTHVLISYRLDRAGYLIFKNTWPALRIFLLPLFISARLLGGNHEIHYQADIGKGLKVLHPGLGIVISGGAIAGKRLLLTGGNCIGVRNHIEPGRLVIGDYVSLGANAVILGPVKLGSHIEIGAGAVVIDDAPDGVILAGVPAKIIRRNDESRKD